VSALHPQNGRAGFLLWTNTILTAVLLPLLAFIGARLWDKIDQNAEKLVRIDERQQNVLRILPEINDRIKLLENKQTKGNP